MRTLQFRCTLLTDVVLNAKAATEGPQDTLDFIPGNCFLGIVANQYDRFKEQGKSMDLFHNGKVRYGDAHPALTIGGENVRSLRVPASFFYPKLASQAERCYVHHAYSRDEDHEGINGRPQQLKQCRTGFYGMADGTAVRTSFPVSFAIKSAYDRSLRRAKDEQMYGYQSLDKGAVFYFEVEVDDDTLADDVMAALCGRQRIGRSRTAQYGLVDISPEQFTQPSSNDTLLTIGGDTYVALYADSRLVFTDTDGQPHTRITAADLGLDGEIDWMKSQVRTFQYAPWNFKRQARDMDRFGMEKGSVIIVRLNTPRQEIPSYVGNYLNEGFGKVIANPWFLSVKPGSNGMAAILFKERESASLKPASDTAAAQKPDTPLLRYLVQKDKDIQAEDFIYRIVNDFGENKAKLFRGKEFASQWGAIRTIAMRCKDSVELRRELLDKKIVVSRSTSVDDSSESKTVNMAFLTHGVAEKKWKERGRLRSLTNFLDELDAYRDAHKVDIAVRATIELASEMAKIITRNGKD